MRSDGLAQNVKSPAKNSILLIVGRSREVRGSFDTGIQ